MIPFRALPRFVPGAKGDQYWRETNGDLTAETYPVGATLGSHVWVTGASGHGVWMTRADFAALLSTSGYAWVYMTTVDGSGATVLATDDDGSPILTLVPVP